MSNSQILNLSSMCPPVFIRETTLECQFKDPLLLWLVAKSCPSLATAWTVAWEFPLSMGFPRQKYRSGLPFPSPRNLPNYALTGRFFATEPPGKPNCCSVAHPYLTLCNPMDCSTPAFPVFHHLPEFAQTYVLWVSGAIQPSHPLSSPSPPAFNIY